MAWPRWPRSWPPLSKTIAAVTPGRSMSVCRIASMSASHRREVVEGPLHRGERPRGGDTDGDHGTPADGDDAPAGRPGDGRARERAQAELLPRLAEARGDEAGDGRDGLAIGLPDGIVEHPRHVAEHRAGDVGDRCDQREVVHV